MNRDSEATKYAPAAQKRGSGILRRLFAVLAILGGLLMWAAFHSSAPGAIALFPIGLGMLLVGGLVALVAWIATGRVW